MLNPSNLQSKAEASYRLAELAKTPRARELFRQLGEDYEKRARGELTAELIEQVETTPSLVPVAPMVADTAPVPTVADASAIADIPLAIDAPPVADTEPPVAPAPVAATEPEAPLVPDVEPTETELFLAALKTFRDEAAHE